MKIIDYIKTLPVIRLFYARRNKIKKDTRHILIGRMNEINEKIGRTRNGSDIVRLKSERARIVERLNHIGRIH